jgi:hypothetical protein
MPETAEQLEAMFPKLDDAQSRALRISAANGTLHRAKCSLTMEIRTTASS